MHNGRKGCSKFANNVFFDAHNFFVKSIVIYSVGYLDFSRGDSSLLEMYIFKYRDFNTY